MGGKRIHTFLGGANPVGGAKVIPRSRGHRYVGGAEILGGWGRWTLLPTLLPQFFSHTNFDEPSE